jgi:membrane fusion protein, heavy metal efflux system
MPVPGRITRLLTGLGDSVRQGQTILSIESPEVGTAAAALQQAEARLSESRAALAKAEADLARTRDLHEHRAIAQKEVIVAEAALAQAQSEVQQSEAMRREALSRLKILGLRADDFGQEVPIRAPVSGKVIEISVAPGDFRTDTSAPLLTIADLSVVYVAADVPESQIRLIHLDETIDVTLTAYPQDSFRGRVARITDIVDPQTRTIKVLAEMPNPHGRLRPEMFAQIRHQENFRTLPVVLSEGLIQSDGRTAVWVQRSSGWFEQVRVEAGRPQRGVVPILSGLSGGEHVVVDGAMLLENWR